MKISVAKKFVALAIVAVLGVGFVACGEKPVTNLDIASVSEKIMTGMKFSEELTEIDKAPALMAYGIEESDVTELKVYVSSGASVDELSVWKTGSVTSAKTVKEKVNARIAKQKQDYQSYKPSEVPKLESAVVETVGDIVVLCVSADSNAKQVVADALK